MDIKQIITDKIIALLEKGGNVSTAPWTKAAGQGMPTNGTTGSAYKGVNVLILWAEAADKGYRSNVWMTYKQAEAIGAQVRKGEKAVMCVYFDRVSKKGTDANGEETDKGYLMAKAFYLFNLAQIDNLPAALVAVPQAATPDFCPITEAQALIDGAGANIAHGFDGEIGRAHV